MKITITMPSEVYAKLEEDRGMVPRSTYIQGLIGGISTEASISGSTPVSSKTADTGSSPVSPASEVVEGKTPGGLNRIISDADAVKMVASALEVATKENWDTVKKILKGEGYEWDIRTMELSKEGQRVHKFNWV